MSKGSNDDAEGGAQVIPASIYTEGGIFLMFPFLIFWSLVAIVCGDPGFVDKKKITKIY